MKLLGLVRLPTTILALIPYVYTSSYQKQMSKKFISLDNVRCSGERLRLYVSLVLITDKLAKQNCNSNPLITSNHYTLHNYIMSLPPLMYTILLVIHQFCQYLSDCTIISDDYFVCLEALYCQLLQGCQLQEFTLACAAG